jgi:hypothetical protein
MENFIYLILIIDKKKHKKNPKKEILTILNL